MVSNILERTEVDVGDLSGLLMIHRSPTGRGMLLGHTGLHPSALPRDDGRCIDDLAAWHPRKSTEATADWTPLPAGWRRAPTTSGSWRANLHRSWPLHHSGPQSPLRVGGVHEPHSNEARRRVR